MFREITLVDQAVSWVHTSQLSAVSVLTLRRDIKPDNLMYSHDGKVILIDLDGMAPYGQPLPYTTAEYGLDLESKGSLEYDLTCLAATLFKLAASTNPSLNLHGAVPRTRRLLLEAAGKHTHVGALLATACLESSDLGVIWGKFREIAAAANETVPATAERIWGSLGAPVAEEAGPTDPQPASVTPRPRQTMPQKPLPGTLLSSLSLACACFSLCVPVGFGRPS